MNQYDTPTPRVTANMLNQYIGQTVRFVGKMDHQDSGAAHLMSDNQLVKVKMSHESIEQSTYNAFFVEVVGKVNADRSIQEISSMSINSMDLPNYEQLVQLMQLYKPLFV